MSIFYIEKSDITFLSQKWINFALVLCYPLEELKQRIGKNGISVNGLVFNTLCEKSGLRIGHFISDLKVGLII